MTAHPLPPLVQTFFTGRLINQLGAELKRTPFGPPVRKIILEIDPDAKDRLPKRKAKQAKKKSSTKDRAAALKKAKKSAKSKK